MLGHISSFAYDTRIGHPIKNTQDVTKLENDPDNICTWAVDNNMQFNIDKFECLHYGTDQTVKANTSYTVNDHTITEKQEVRDQTACWARDAYYFFGTPGLIFFRKSPLCLNKFTLLCMLALD